MTTFTYKPDYGASADREPRVKSLRFGDGYEQRQSDGINTLAQKWNVTFSNRDVSEIDAIETFLTTCEGVDYFQWTPPRSVTVGNYICRRWQRQVVKGLVDTVTAMFEEVFDE